MSHNDSITNMLDLKDPRINFKTKQWDGVTAFESQIHNNCGVI